MKARFLTSFFVVGVKYYLTQAMEQHESLVFVQRMCYNHIQQRHSIQNVKRKGERLWDF